MKRENRQKLLVVVALIAAVLLVSDYLLLAPMQKAWKNRSDRIQQLERNLQAGRALLSREQTLRSRWSSMVSNTLPRDFSTAEQQLLQAFDQWSRQSRITVTSLNPQWRSDSEEYMTLQCRVEATGDLSTITRFLYSIEKDPMAIRIDSLELASRDTSGSQIALTLQVSGLVLTPDQKQETRQELHAAR